MHQVDDRKMKMTPEFQKELDEFSPGLQIEPDLVGNDWRWNIVDPANSEVLEYFTLKASRVATLKNLDGDYRLDDYTRAVIRNALMRLRSQDKWPRK